MPVNANCGLVLATVLGFLIDMKRIEWGLCSITSCATLFTNSVSLASGKAVFMPSSNGVVQNHITNVVAPDDEDIFHTILGLGYLSWL